MGYLLIADDGTDLAAPARREAARPAHLDSIHAAATRGILVMSGPRMPDDRTTRGSLQVFDADQAAMDAYMAAEPFAHQGVWQKVDLLPFRIAPMPWPPQPGRPGGPTGPRVAYAIIARDGTDPDAPARRTAIRPRHFARLGGEMAAGRLLLGGALLDAPEDTPGAAMIGSLVALDLPDEAAVRDWLDQEPYMTEGVWRDIRIERWRIGAQPYPPLPGAA